MPQRFNQAANSWRSGVKGLEGSYRRGISIGGHGNNMLFGTDVNSSRLGVDQVQALEMNSFAGFVFLFAHSL
jgi:hypothetical protein